MSWPLASHFSAMLQNPAVAFRDPALQRAVVEKDAKNQPRPWAGAFAVVYKAADPQRGDPFAIRIFTSESPERRERYEQISAYLKTRRLRCLLDFEYRDRSIRSAGDGKWYPLILMEWVQGETLFRWLRERCLAGDAAAIGGVAERWVEVVKELSEACVAHGDLQHANVMIADNGDVKLVDYDCMCVPALVGRRNLEVGVEPYQHPGRNEHTLLALDLDGFSALMIYVALRALALQPQLWQKYVEQPGYDKLLFRKEDIAQPQGSPLHQDLMALPDAEVRDLAAHLFNLARGPMDQVPPLSQLANPYAKVERMLVHQQWHEAVQLLNRRGSFRDAPPHLKLLINQAYEHVCRQEAWTRFVKVPGEISEANDRALADVWNEKLFAGFEPAEKERIRVGEARHRVAMVDRLRYLVQQLSGKLTYAGEQSVVEAASHLPEGYKHGLAGRVDEAKRRVAALQRFERVIHAPPTEAAVVAAWRSLGEAKCEALVNPSWQPRIELAQQRAPLLKLLAEMPPDLPADQRDRRLLETWNEPLFADCAEAAAWRPMHAEALARREALGRLQEAIDRRDEEAICAAAQTGCLAGYPLPHALAAVVRTTCDRVTRRDALLAVLREGRREAFREAFDARMIRQYPEAFSPYRRLLDEWIESEVLPAEAMGLRPALGRASLIAVEEDDGNYRVRWTWPATRFAEQCLLGIVADEPRPDQDPQQLPMLLRLIFDRQNWEAAGGSRLLSADESWDGATAVVWAVVDLGYATRHSRPLVLGRFQTRGWWKKLFGGRRPGPAAMPEGPPPDAADAAQPAQGPPP